MLIQVPLAAAFSRQCLRGSTERLTQPFQQQVLQSAIGIGA